jgi:hypothetical protein
MYTHPPIMSVSNEQPSKQTRKRDWLDWGQGIVALLTALLAVWINLQQQGLKSQQDKIDLTLKKESTTTLFADKILQQVNTLSEESSKVKGAIILELMGLDIQAHLESSTGEDKQLKGLEDDCKQIPSRIALFTANYDALDASDEAKWVQYAYNTDNRIARHTALIALGVKALQPEHLSSADSLPPNSASRGPATADLLVKRFDEILKLSDNLESPDLAIDALDAISRLAERYQDISPQLRGTQTFGLILHGMRGLQNRLNLQGSNDALHQLKQQSKDDLKQQFELKQQLHDQLTHLDLTWKSLVATKFCFQEDRQLVATGSSTAR